MSNFWGAVQTGIKVFRRPYILRPVKGAINQT
nr:MAG TPA: hypothetical protein [Inoviridae sp.]